MGMLPLPDVLHREDGAVSPMRLAVFFILVLALMFLRPLPERVAAFRDALGPEVIVEEL